MTAADKPGAGNKTRSLAIWMTAVLVMIPLAIYAYLGQFSRMMGDDWGYFANIQWLGFRDNFLYWWNSWQSSYTFLFAIELLSMLGPRYVPPVFPALVLLIWLVGLAWLVALTLRYLGFAGDNLPLSIILAAFLMLAGVAAFPTLESIFWFSATIRQTLPVGIFALYLAFMLEVCSRNWPKRRLAAAASVGAIASFLNGGFSEVWVLLQILYFVLLLVVIRAVADRRYRKPAWAIIVAGWLGSCASLGLQLHAPGIRARMQIQLSLESVDQHRSLALLAGEVWNEVSYFVAHQGGLAGFALTMAVGLTASLLLARPERHRCSAEHDMRVKRIGILAVIALSFTAVGVVATVSIGQYTAGAVFPRTLVSSAILKVLCGMMLGCYLGFLIQRDAASTPMGTLRKTGFVFLGVTVSASIVLSMVINQIGLIPDFQTFAQDWDARHRRIVQWRENGESDVEVAPLRFDLSEFIAANGRSFDSVSPYYYQVDSIITAEDPAP